MRILYISRGGQIGGSQRQLYYLAAGLDRSRYEPIVICCEEGSLLDLLRREGIQSHLLPLYPWRKWPGSVWRFIDVRKLVRFASHQRIGLVHAADLWQSGYALSVARSLKVPAVLHARGPSRPREVRKNRCQTASAVIAISPRVRADLIAGGVPQDKIAVIRDAVDRDRFHPRLRQTNILRGRFSPAPGALLGIAGCISPSKRQLDFLRVVERLTRTIPGSSTFFVIGETLDTFYYQRLRSFVDANGLAKRVVFTGRREDMPEVLASLDVLVTLSGGSVMIEAMACGTPVVSAGFTPAGRSTIVLDGRTGLLVSSDKPGDLEAALRRLIESPQLRQQLGRQARRHVESSFGHTDLVAATQRLYGKILLSNTTS